MSIRDADKPLCNIRLGLHAPLPLDVDHPGDACVRQRFVTVD